MANPAGVSPYGISAIRQASRTFRALAIFCFAVSAAGCRTPLSSLDAAGPMAGSIATLWWIMFFTASALFVLVIALFGWAYRKPGFAADTSPRTWLLHAGVIMPSVLLAALAAFAFVLGQRLVTRSDPNIVHVEALATRWAWHFRYPDLDAAPTVSILHIPAGRTVEVRVISEDVIHSFWVPRLAGKIDAIPGHRTRVQFVADRPGEYEGVCAEFCGIGHTEMRFRVIAHDENEFRVALKSRTVP